MTSSDPRLEILEHIRFLAQKDFLWAGEGNFSLRGEGGFWITPRGKEKRQLSVEDFVWVPLTGEVPENASSEWPFHRAIHQNTPFAVVYHTHPPFTVAASTALPPVYGPTLEEVRLLDGDIPVVEAPTGTRRLAEALMTWLCQGYRAVILRNHGLLVVGDTPQEAFHRTLRVEREFQVGTLRRLWRA